MCGPKGRQSEGQGVSDEHQTGSLLDASHIMRRDIVLTGRKVETGQEVEVQPYPSEHDAWHAAIKKVHQIPDPARANGEARDFALEAGGTNGISHVQCVRFTGVNGYTVEGGEFQVGGKRIFRSGRDTYAVEKTEDGTYALRSRGNPLSEPFIAQRVEQLTPLNSAITRISDSTGIPPARIEPLVRGQISDMPLRPAGNLRETLVSLKDNTGETRKNNSSETREAPVREQVRQTSSEASLIGRGVDRGTIKTVPGAEQTSLASHTQPMPIQRAQTVPFDLKDKETREFLSEALKRVEIVRTDTSNQRSRFLQDVLNGLDSSKIEKLQAFLNQGTDASKGNKPLDETAVTRLRHLLAGKELGPERGTASDATAHNNIQKSALERMIEFLRNNRELLVNGIAQNKDSKPILGEIVRIVGDLGRQMPSERAQNNICFSDILFQTLHSNFRVKEKSTNGAVGALPCSAPISDRLPPDKTDPVNFIARLTPAQEQQLKAWLDKSEHRTDTAQHDGATANGDISRIDGARIAPFRLSYLESLIGVRSDLCGRQELTLVSKTDIGGLRENMKEEPLASRLDQIIARGEAGLNDRAARGSLDTKFDTVNLIDPFTGKITKPDSVGIKDDSLRPDLVEPVDLTAGSYIDGKEVEGAIADNDLLGQYTSESESEKESKADDESRKEEEQNLLNLALLAQLRTRKEKADRVRKDKGRAQEEDKRREHRRRRYKVKEHDTLESIAAKELNDVKLAALIYELNKNIIPRKVEEAKEVIELPSGLVIWLPSALDVQDFRQRMCSSGMRSPQAVSTKQYESVEEELVARLGTNWNGDAASKSPQSVSEPAVATAAPQIAVSKAEAHSETLSGKPADPVVFGVTAFKTRRANIEKLLGPIGPNVPDDGRLRYVVRLGDTLKSISMKHPALQDVSLWKLLAQVNNLPAPLEGKAVTTQHLSRGTTLIIPSAEEIDKFRAKTSSRSFAPVTTGSVTNSNTAETVAKPCKQCGRLTVLSATICPACKHPFVSPGRSDAILHKTSSAAASQGSPDNSESAAVGMLKAAGFVSRDSNKQSITSNSALKEVEIPSQAPEQVREFNELLSDSCRLVRSGVELEQDRCLTSRIEVKNGNDWKPVISYEIYPDVSLRHEYSTDGHRKTVRIDLPPTAASELASNDLTSNWQEYSKEYLS